MVSLCKKWFFCVVLFVVEMIEKLYFGLSMGSKRSFWVKNGSKVDIFGLNMGRNGLFELKTDQKSISLSKNGHCYNILNQELIENEYRYMISY
jgi:hypothetical protein